MAVKPCVNCMVVKKITSRGLCGACYKYQRLNGGTPRPLEYAQRDAEQAYFYEEWEHMTITMAMDPGASMRRLAEAFGITRDAVKQRVLKKYGTTL